LLPVDETAERGLKMGLPRSATAKQPPAIHTSDGRIYLGTSILTPPRYLRSFIASLIPSPLPQLQIKREEFGPMTQSYPCHNAFLSSKEVIIANKGRSTPASVCDVNDKAELERTCVACVFLFYLVSPKGKEGSIKMAVEKAIGSSSLVEVIDRILDKGIVVDAWVRVSLVGIEILAIEARIVAASVETYLKYAEAIGLTATAA
jgi:hypothetical protein